MALEIERKFLVTDDGWRALCDNPQRIRQAYLARSKMNSIRVRIVDEHRGRLTIKSRYRGISRDEFEYDIPVGEALELLDLRHGSVIEKARYRVPIGGLVWEVDVFHGANEGLIVAEVELTCEDQPIDMPRWVGREVSDDMRYQNSALAETPFTTWSSEAVSEHLPTLM